MRARATHCEDRDTCDHKGAVFDMSIIIACEWGASCTRNRFALAWHMPLPNGALREQMWKNNGTLSSTTSSGRSRCVRPAAHRAKQRADDICAVETWLLLMSTHHGVCKVLLQQGCGETPRGYPACPHALLRRASGGAQRAPGRRWRGAENEFASGVAPRALDFATAIAQIENGPTQQRSCVGCGNTAGTSST
jgi:hypothetical protein